MLGSQRTSIRRLQRFVDFRKEKGGRDQQLRGVFVPQVGASRLERCTDRADRKALPGATSRCCRVRANRDFSVA